MGTQSHFTKTKWGAQILKENTNLICPKLFAFVRRMLNLVCLVVKFAEEYKVKRIVDQGEMPEEVINLEVGLAGAEKVKIEENQEISCKVNQ